MNKQDLSNHLKLSVEKIDEILTAAVLPLDAPNYNGEQVKLVEEIHQLVVGKKAKTYKEAGTLIRKGRNEHELNEIALRQQIPAEQIPEIVKAMKLKVESLTEVQFESFREVCKMVHSGMDLALAAQNALDLQKAAKTTKAKAESKTPSSIATANGSNGSVVAQANGAILNHVQTSIPDQTAAKLRQISLEEAKRDQTGLTEEAASAIFDTSDHLRSGAREYGRELYFAALGEVMADKATIQANEAVIDEVKKRRRPAK